MLAGNSAEPSAELKLKAYLQYFLSFGVALA